ncbi:hypothetical protein PV08_00247 [Exophiala spinifera]|uniref:DUF2241 domain-containing protein n=1 Tax=Exophiala spinifera TaxID=91928 RepID=A0A0D2BL37_9EURO|nr:uncharacterized protein PV08_00247 [Exophiala spinifera]KIW19673.1 hypothetical protein PV08_00247 [Exophiala spinifera]
MAAVGETSLQTLLSSLTLVLHEPTYVFLTIPHEQFRSPFMIPFADILLSFREAEGVTLVVTQSLAEQHALAYQYPCRMITCNVHSSLEAVGFMAHLATKLAGKGLSVNPVSGYFHDHLFVPVEKAREAVEVLEKVREDAERATTSLKQ